MEIEQSEFWLELQGSFQKLPSESDVVAEDELVDPQMEDGLDDSEIPLGAAIEMVVNGICPDGISVDENGGLKLDGDAENCVPQEFGHESVAQHRGRRTVIPNKWYSQDVFWRHDDGDEAYLDGI